MESPTAATSAMVQVTLPTHDVDDAPLSSHDAEALVEWLVMDRVAIVTGRFGKSPNFVRALAMGAYTTSYTPLYQGFQIWDDYLDATASKEILGKPSGSDIVQGKRTLLVIKTLEKAEKKQGKRLQEILDNDNNENSDIIEAVKIMKETGALDECEKIALEHLEGAKKTLSKYPDSGARKDLEELLRFMVERKY